MFGRARMLSPVRVKSLATQLRVVDLERAVRFYVEKLGFTLQFRAEDFYVGLSGGGAMLHLKRVDSPDPSIPFVVHGDHLHLYLTVRDLDAAFSELAGNAEIVSGIATKPWGAREFTIRDPDGHTIYFAEDPSPSGSP